MKKEVWESLSPFIDRALELDPAAREALVSELAAERPDLVSTFRRILAEHEWLLGSDFLESVESLGIRPVRSLAGQSIGAYTLDAPLGMGGMGTVWRAHRSDGRYEGSVALKLLNLALIGRGDERFRREGTFLAALSHPNIARLLDAGVTSGGQPYLVLEYVEGARIDRWADERRLGVRERLELFLQMAEAVGHAHAHLIVHRDLKPSNVLVRPDGQVKLLDFGIGKLLEPNDADEPTLTGEIGAALTPEYAAPEQIAREAVTTATDVYALGVLLYLLLTGRHPAGEAVHSPAELMKSIMDAQPPRPSAVDIDATAAAARSTTADRLKRTLRGDLDTIVAKALKKAPAERYSGVGAFEADVRRYLRHEPIAARPDAFLYRTARFVRRNRVAAGLAVLVLIASGAGLTAVLLQARTVRAQRDLAFRQVARAEELAGLNELLIREAAPAGKPFTASDLLARAERIAARQGDRRDPAHIDTLVSIGMSYWALDQDAAARRVLDGAYARSRHISDPSSRARAACALAVALARGADLVRAEALIQEGLNEVGSHPELVLDRAYCLTRGSIVDREAGRPAETIRKLELARQQLKDSSHRSPQTEISLLMNLADAHRATGDHVRAVSNFQQASDGLVALGRDETQQAATLYNNWGLSLFQIGRPLDAERVLRRAIDIERSDASEESVSPMLLVNYARTLRELDRLDAAEDYAERAHGKAERADDQIVIIQSLLERGRIYRARGDYARSGAILETVEPRLRRALPEGHPAFAALASEQAQQAAATGNPARAQALADQGVGMADATFRKAGQGGDLLAVVLLRRSEVRLKSGRAADATADAERARDLLAQSAPQDARLSTLGRAHLAVAKALAAQGRVEDARRSAGAALEHLQSALGPRHPETQSALQLSRQAP